MRCLFHPTNSKPPEPGAQPTSIRCCPARGPPSLVSFLQAIAGPSAAGFQLGSSHSLSGHVPCGPLPAQKRPKRHRNQHGSQIQTKWQPHGTPPLLPTRLAFFAMPRNPAEQQGGRAHSIETRPLHLQRRDRPKPDGSGIHFGGARHPQDIEPLHRSTWDVDHTTTWPRHPHHKLGSPRHTRPWRQ